MLILRKQSYPAALPGWAGLDARAGLTLMLCALRLEQRLNLDYYLVFRPKLISKLLRQSGRLLLELNLVRFALEA